jgi:hypothetical protein
MPLWGADLERLIEDKDTLLVRGNNAIKLSTSRLTPPEDAHNN